MLVYKHTRDIAKKVVEDLKQYQINKGIGEGTVAKELGCSHSNVTLWMKGKGLPSPLNIQRCIDAGITSERLPSRIQQQAREKKIVTEVLQRADDDNRIPRMYRKSVVVPPIISNQIKLLIDDYMSELEQPNTYQQFNLLREELIRKVYYICRQG